MDLFSILFSAVSPNLKDLVLNFISSLPGLIKDSDNPLDKFFVNFLLDLFKIKD
ncbi:hypothetical protein ES705_23382 [subsurface metagenome]